MPENLYTGDDALAARDNVVEKDRLVWTRMVLLRFTAFTQPSNTSPEAGQAPNRNFFGIEVSAAPRLMTGKDIVANNGLYALGDVEMTLRMPIFDANNRNVTQADQLLWDGITYTLIGRPWRVPVAGGNPQFKGVFRRSS